MVAEATDGREVLASYVNHKPDLMTLDIGMANVDGIEALQTLLRNSPQAKVIIVSAMGQKQQVLKAISRDLPTGSCRTGGFFAVHDDIHLYGGRTIRLK